MATVIALATAALLLATTPAIPPAPSASGERPAISVSGERPAASTTGDRLVARTESGLVRGARADGVERFLALPYAAPPVGDLRWRAPQPPPTWQGVRAADAWGNRCPAAAGSNGPRSETEDCLYLNVFRPEGTRAGQRLPVLFWIHGGGLVNGSANQHDGTLIAQLENVVVVSVNYRLGVLGYLVHPALAAESGQAGNYGLLDQQAALRWVRRNIAAFGGDPRRVTIDGESAGGFSVCAHLTAPGSAGLFARGIMQSGSCVSRPIEDGERTGTQIAATLGCPDPATAAACLRALPPGRLIDGPQYTSFTHGTPALPESPDTAVRAGRFQRVPLMIGYNRDEGRTFFQGNRGWTRERYEEWVRTVFGDRAAAVLERYPWPARSDAFTPAYLTGAIATDAGLFAGIGGCPALRLARDLSAYTTVYGYRFDHRTGPGLTPEPAGYVWGAGHAAELAYLWPSFDNGTPIAPTFDAGERRLARDMVHYWGGFTRTGQPYARGSARWPRLGDAVMSLRAAGRSTPVPEATMAAEHQCDLWQPGSAGSS
ncbi:carboxylesterase family protein [Nonomuraea sp. FMUSA5-5]|uniref:Carboxylic ester hydrolase n=1 Tax=Nonomuraea composti TaxID=2720023 RepID=A0ABX1B4R5_9ACTN|nr:carboxylesterase family protein [Nonomuraea sp. FMUSA5-5]NJP91319.1 carboxylesterase family protein [Nonomuraea sp. FMUSA5-5]